MSEIGPIVNALVRGTWVTVDVMLGAACLGSFVALAAGITSLANQWYVRILARTYVEIFRGTSAIIQLFWIFFVLPSAGIILPPIAAAIIALGLNAGAYGAEIVRGSIQSIPRGQWEAATALNMTAFQRLRLVVLPQAVVAMLPPYGNLLIELLKATSLVSLVAVTDITQSGLLLRSATGQPLVFGGMLILYFLLASIIAEPLRLVEKSLARRRGQTAGRWSVPL